MPLIHSSSKKALKKNIETEMKSNPKKADRSQNLAIAYATQRAARRKRMAEGGKIEEYGKGPEADGEDGVPARKPDDLRPTGYMTGSGLDIEGVPERKPDDERPPESDYMTRSGRDPRAAFKDGGMVDSDEESLDMIEEDESEEPMDLVDAIRYKMAGGGRIPGKRAIDMDEDAAMNWNAQEQPNMEDQYSFDALDHQAYDEAPAMDELDYDNSESVGDELEDEDENGMDVISSIRRKMQSR